MSERKVLNKYYPPDFDPSKIPRMKLPKNRQYTVRLMAPFNMRCKTCGEYIYKGKKFNARKEDVEGEDYFGIRIYRFYIKCTRCLQEISFKTDPKNTDYEIEAGATRNFMALKLAEEQAQREEDERKEEEANNPMKLLENRTQQSKQELELLESLEDLKDLNRRQRSIDYDAMLSQYDTKEAQEKILKLQEEQDEKLIKCGRINRLTPIILSDRMVKSTLVTILSERSVFGGNKRVIEEEVVDAVDEDKCGPAPSKKITTISKLSTVTSSKNQAKVDTSWSRSVGVMSKKPLNNLVRIKKQEPSVKCQPKQETVTHTPSSVKSELPKSANNCQEQKPSSLFSLVGAYSDSDESGSN